MKHEQSSVKESTIGVHTSMEHENSLDCSSETNEITYYAVDEPIRPTIGGGGGFTEEFSSNAEYDWKPYINGKRKFARLFIKSTNNDELTRESSSEAFNNPFINGKGIYKRLLIKIKRAWIN